MNSKPSFLKQGVSRIMHHSILTATLIAASAFLSACQQSPSSPTGGSVLPMAPGLGTQGASTTTTLWVTSLAQTGSGNNENLNVSAGDNVTVNIETMSGGVDVPTSTDASSNYQEIDLNDPNSYLGAATTGFSAVQTGLAGSGGALMTYSFSAPDTSGSAHFQGNYNGNGTKTGSVVSGYKNDGPVNVMLHLHLDGCTGTGLTLDATSVSVTWSGHTGIFTANFHLHDCNGIPAGKLQGGLTAFINKDNTFSTSPAYSAIKWNNNNTPVITWNTTATTATDADYSVSWTRTFKSGDAGNVDPITGNWSFTASNNTVLGGYTDPITVLVQ
jgi:hypothetical protein